MNKKISALFSLFTVAWLANSAEVMAMATRPVDPNTPPPPFWVSWTPMIVMIAVFYFLLIRPQIKQKKERQTMMSNLKKGDRVVTQGGLFATVVNVLPQVVEVKLNEDTKVRILRSAVSEVIPDHTVSQQAEEAEVVSQR